MRWAWVVLSVGLGGLAGCAEVGCGPAAADAPAAERVTLSVVGLNDLHGHVRRLPWVGGYVERLRAVRAQDGGGVLVVDAGDLFQGTLESNLGEGAAVVDGYEALGLDAAAVGNHEFDFGPVGPAAVATGAADDPRGALLARAAEADFPLLAANLHARETGRRVEWPGLPATHVVERAGVRVGLIGVTTEATLETTLRANVSDLEVAPLAATIAREAAALRADGAAVVIVLAHAGGRCARFDDPDVLDGCDADAEIVRMVRALPAGAVDAVVAGHTHQAMAHRVAGVPVIESYAYGTAFGRVDLRIDRAAGRVVDSTLFAPQPVCRGDGPGRDVPADRCRPFAYEGGEVAPSAAVAAAIAPHLARAQEAAERPLGVTLAGRFPDRYGDETALGNLFADLMREARPEADVALQNGGGIRAALPRGALRYGAFYRAFPFDNRFAFVRLRARDLASMVARSLRGGRGFLSISGVSAVARCEGRRVEVRLLRDGRELGPDVPLVVVTNEYLVTTNDPVLRRLPPGSIEVEDGPPLREVLVERLRARGGTLRPEDFFDSAAPRVRRCAP